MARVAVLMSGGVDSSVAAALLTQQGHEVTGITARMSGPSSACCDDEDIYLARRVCDRLGIAHIVLDLRKDFDLRVLGPFIEGYFEGLTPNPCAVCNREIKLGKILGLALRSGFDRLASGHYARIGRIGARPVLCEPAEGRKSQVYFLALVGPEVLDHLEFPLGDIEKHRVREIAANLGLAVRQGESQDLCFVPAGGYRRILSDRWDGPEAGDVLDSAGSVVGRHRGHYTYTVGQRFGLRGRRYYVIEKHAGTNQIVIAERDSALKRSITVSSCNLLMPLDDLPGGDLTIKYRYNSPRVGAKVVETDGRSITFRASKPCFAPAPGQILACYWRDCMVCGGIIESAA
jgi:tRNA-specific 2-thiouridylase